MAGKTVPPAQTKKPGALARSVFSLYAVQVIAVLEPVMHFSANFPVSVAKNVRQTRAGLVLQEPGEVVSPRIDAKS